MIDELKQTLESLELCLDTETDEYRSGFNDGYYAGQTNLKIKSYEAHVKAELN